MKESSSDPPDIDRLRPSEEAKTSSRGFLGRVWRKPTGHHQAGKDDNDDGNKSADVGASEAASHDMLTSNLPPGNGVGSGSNEKIVDDATGKPGNVGANGRRSLTPPLSQQQRPAPADTTASSPDGGRGTVIETQLGRNDNGGGDDGAAKPPKPGVAARFYRTARAVLFHSWINVLLVFVPIGIIVAEVPGIHAGVIFGVNCIAIIPLAGLLSHATESVARKLGDAIGALLNVTFGNAVELIIFIIALEKNQIRIVQAALLGSILANLLMILGMCFFLGGLRFREQIYNSTVTQMSACLLSLSVCSLVLPTAFHASFKDQDDASEAALKVSRGCSIVLLLVYVIYLLFQLKSHAYLYESTPQHIVDAEATPGPVANWLDTSSSDSSSSSSSDTDDSSSSRGTVRKKMKKVLRRRRKNSVASADASTPTFTRTPSFTTVTSPPNEDRESSDPEGLPSSSKLVEGLEEAVEEEKSGRWRKSHKRRKYGKHRKHGKRSSQAGNDDVAEGLEPTISERPEPSDGETRRVDFAIPEMVGGEAAQGTAGAGGTASGPGHHHGSKRPLPGLRAMSIKNLAPPVFVHKPEPGVAQPTPTGPVPRVRYGIRRTNSLPDRLNTSQQLHQPPNAHAGHPRHPHSQAMAGAGVGGTYGGRGVPGAGFRPPGAMLPSQIPLMALTGGNAAEPYEHEHPDEDNLSRTAAVILLVVSTGLVALCAEFLIDSIHEVVEAGGVKEAFIGLIILPIVGNAAEHVTAITVALKNKMDLAIGVAVGSSIQIALFITPLVVLLGWAMDRQMTLYFTLFETVCLFVSAFIVNFLVLDGRSNYLEGALLLCTYVIIGVVAAFYPDADDVSQWG